jgi:two-component system sensor kinase FixL
MGAGRDLFARRKDDTEFQVEIGLNPIQTREGNFVLTAVVDITERKRAASELRRQREELAHVTRISAMGELSASLAHELNQPLTAILSNANAAQRFLAASPPELDEVREILKDIVQDNSRAAEIIRRVRGLVKKGELEVAPVDITQVIRDIVPLVHSDAVLRNIRLVLDFHSNIPLVHGDKVQLQQVVLNLLLNAFDAIKDCPGDERGVVVQVELDHAHAVKVAVRDRARACPPTSSARFSSLSTRLSATG